MNQNILDSIRRAPGKPGVYLWKNERGGILYVGKAENLRKRLSNYLKPKDPKTMRLVENAVRVEWILTKTDVEALILEDALVKQNQPRYNVRLRDDKRYPYIKLTVNERLPEIQVVRRVELDGSRYFGPYTDPGSVRKFVKLVRTLFGIRKCGGKAYSIKRPCIDYSMGICTAPCQVMGEREYQKRVEQAARFLAGDYEKVKRNILLEIKDLSEKLEYEKARDLKKTFEAMESLSVAQDVSSAKLKDMDILGYAFHLGKANITQMKVRDHKVVAVLHHPLKGEYLGDGGQSVKAFIKQHYTTEDITPKLIYTSAEAEDRKLLEKTLSEIRGGKVEIRMAVRGQYLKLAEMAVENSLHQIIAETLEKKKVSRLELLQKGLGLTKMPRRIEGYDISNIGEKATVGGMVVFTNGVADKSQYRKFRIRQPGQNDCRNMAEMVGRRFNHPEWERPDLILLDGGKPQLNACLKKIPSGIPVIALAKKEEEIYLPDKKTPIILKKDNPALHLLMEVRDESHRYSKSYHEKKRRGG
ncbi:MAG TPA: excinuclease ABC subunit UvrC [Candidatus Altiarchaeales archaeon]|nr:excinuclease ABC subunit UvrC [Candidatus Altiarchaeales archaeon]